MASPSASWAALNSAPGALPACSRCGSGSRSCGARRNRIEAQFTALRYFALDGTDHTTHQEQASMICRYIIWRNNHAYDKRLRRIIDRAANLA